MMSEKLSDGFSFYQTSEMKSNVEFNIISLEGHVPKITAEDILKNPNIRRKPTGPDLIIKGYLWSDFVGLKLTMDFFSSFKEFASSRQWSEWMSVPLRYCDTLRDTKLVLTILECQGGFSRVAIGGTCINLFESNTRLLRKEQLALKVWTQTEGHPLNTPGEFDETESCTNKFAKLAVDHQLSQVPKNDWIDRLSLNAIEKVSKSMKDKCTYMTLTISFKKFDCDVMWWDPCKPFTEEGQPDELAYFDPDIDEENWCEKKHKALTRNIKAAESDKHEKPNPLDRDWIIQIGFYPPNTTLTPKEEDILWRYRYFACAHTRLLSKFLSCVNFDSEVESKTALDMLSCWTPLDQEDALELLGPNFQNDTVRQYAVQRLKEADSKQMQLYLLYLVEALRYEPWGLSDDNSFHKLTSMSHYSLCNVQDSILLSTGPKVLVHSDHTQSSAMDSSSPVSSESTPDNELYSGISSIAHDEPPLAKFLIDRACEDPVLANYLYWYVNLQAEKEKVEVTGIVPEKISFFKSSLEPCKLTFRTTDGSEYSTIFKYGDDLRQDQLILQLITIMDNVLRSDGVMLHLTPYKVLPTKDKAGFLQYIDSHPISEILQTEGSIQSFFQKYSPSKSDPYGIKAETLETYVESCAGYCVITYILGIGDRHNDNLLITKDGRFFHIDFGYIFGHDPKPFALPIKLSKDMIDGMCGDSQRSRFQKLCKSAFIVLRKNTKVLLNLVSLMLDSFISTIPQSSKDIIQFIQDKLYADMDEEQALYHFKNMLDKSSGAITGAMMENIHRVAMYLRK